MKFILTFFILFPTSVLHAETPLDKKQPRHTVTIDYLLESCTVIGETAGGMIPYFDCESYIYGVLDSYLAARDSVKQNERACFPENIAPWEVYNELLSAPAPKNGSKPAAPCIIDILQKKYPCKTSDPAL